MFASVSSFDLTATKYLRSSTISGAASVVIGTVWGTLAVVVISTGSTPASVVVLAAAGVAVGTLSDVGKVGVTSAIACLAIDPVDVTSVADTVGSASGIAVAQPVLLHDSTATVASLTGSTLIQFSLLKAIGVNVGSAVFNTVSVARTMLVSVGVAVASLTGVAVGSDVDVGIAVAQVTLHKEALSETATAVAVDVATGQLLRSGRPLVMGNRGLSSDHTTFPSSSHRPVSTPYHIAFAGWHRSSGQLLRWLQPSFH